MLSLQFPPVPRTINISFSSHHGNKLLPNKNIIRDAPNNSAKSCNTLINSSLLKFRLAGVPICATSEIDNQEKTEIELPEGLVPELMPKHVAVIMDGNRRWAKKRGLPIQLGHRAGGRVIKQLAINCRNYGVQVLTVFAFSTENWVRPKDEVDFLMNLFEEVVQSDIEERIQKGDRLSVVGNISGLPESLQKVLYSSQERSKDNKGLHIVFALNYSGRYDITEATKKVAAKVKDGVLQVEDIIGTVFEQHLETNGLLKFPSPDLLIRTSGELRVSNFMLWQLAYTELMFIDKLFPDFDDTDLVEALTAFQLRQRRYGGGHYKY